MKPIGSLLARYEPDTATAQYVKAEKEERRCVRLAERVM